MELTITSAPRSWMLHESLIDDEDQELEFSVLKESESPKTERDFDDKKLSFLFLDGTVVELLHEVHFREEDLEFYSGLFVLSVGCGFENGRILKHRTSLVILIPESLGETKRNEIGRLLSTFVPHHVILLPTYHQRSTKTISVVLERLRREELTLLNEILKDVKNSIPVIDGNIRGEITEMSQIGTPVVGIVKDFRWPLRFIENMKNHWKSDRMTDIIYAEIKGRKRFSFFLRLKDDNTSVIRVDFVHPDENDDRSVLAFSRTLAKKILSWSQSIGDRAPKNITPMRILEKRLRALAGDRRLTARKLMLHSRTPFGSTR